MPVENKYVYSVTQAGKKGQALQTNGTTPVVMKAVVAIAAADDDGSIYRVFPDVPANAVPLMISINNTAVTGGTDYDLGFYRPNFGALVDRDNLMDGASMATARNMDVVNNVGLTTVAHANALQTVGQLSGETTPQASYDIALTANTVGTAAGTIVVTGVFAFV